MSGGHRPTGGAFGPLAEPVWTFSHRHLRSVYRLMWQLRVEGSAPEAPCVVAANHFSHLDPALVGHAVGPVHYLAVDELYGHSRFFDALTLWLGAIPMSRMRAPLGALKRALTLLADGHRVGLFPEGRRVWTWGEVEDPKQGAAWLAMRAGVPLVPVALWGSQYSMGMSTRGLRPAPVALRIGPPLAPGDFSDRHQLTQAWRSWMDDAIPALRRLVTSRSLR